MGRLLALVIATFALALPAAATDPCEGFSHPVDGCITVEQYSAMLAPEALGTDVTYHVDGTVTYTQKPYTLHPGGVRITVVAEPLDRVLSPVATDPVDATGTPIPVTPRDILARWIPL